MGFMASWPPGLAEDSQPGPLALQLSGVSG